MGTGQQCALCSALISRSRALAQDEKAQQQHLVGAARLALVSWVHKIDAPNLLSSHAIQYMNERMKQESVFFLPKAASQSITLKFIYLFKTTYI